MRDIRTKKLSNKVEAIAKIEEITIGIYEINFSLMKMIEDLKLKEDLICSIASRGKYQLTLKKI